MLAPHATWTKSRACWLWWTTRDSPGTKANSSTPSEVHRVTKTWYWNRRRSRMEKKRAKILCLLNQSSGQRILIVRTTRLRWRPGSMAYSRIHLTTLIAPPKQTRLNPKHYTTTTGSNLEVSSTLKAVKLYLVRRIQPLKTSKPLEQVKNTFRLRQVRFRNQTSSFLRSLPTVQAQISLLVTGVWNSLSQALRLRRTSRTRWASSCLFRRIYYLKSCSRLTSWNLLCVRMLLWRARLTPTFRSRA